jgi:hypothetical protein
LKHAFKRKIAMSTSADSEPFNTALADGLREAMDHADEHSFHGAGSRLIDKSRSAGAKGVATSAIELLRRYPAIWVTGIAVVVYLLSRRTASE